MFQSGFLIPGHQSSCFWVGILLQWSICFHMSIKARSFVSLSICTLVNLKSVATHSVAEKHLDAHSHALFLSIFFSDTHTHTHTYTQTQTASLEMVKACGGWRVGKTPAWKSSTERPVVCVIDEIDFCFAVWFGQWPGQVPHQRRLSCV